jgi:hypothetical protein
MHLIVIEVLFVMPDDGFWLNPKHVAQYTRISNHGSRVPLSLTVHLLSFTQKH